MPVTLLSAPPAALSREELLVISAETPASFEGIPPLTRHHEPQGVQIRVDPPLDTFTGTAAGARDGQLWVTDEALSFFSPSAGAGISLPYPHLTLHAISRQPAPAGDAAAQGGACIYCQFEESATLNDDDEGLGTREMWITPEAEQGVDAIFSALSLCASLHPTPGAGPSFRSESDAANGDGPGAMFAAMGLDPSSMVYAAADGSLAGPGLALVDGEGQWEDADGEQEQQQGESSAGRRRSDFVNEGRARGAPY